MDIPLLPQAVTFDCWSTLIKDVSWDATLGRRRDALIEVAIRHEVALDSEKAMELIEGSWQEHMVHWRRGELFGPSGAARWVAGHLGVGVSETEAEGFVGDLAEALSGATREVGTVVVDGAAEAVAAVRGAGIPTALICDTGFTPGTHVREFLDGHGLELDHYFFSDEVGAPKPYPPIFKAALEATGADASKAVHIGDLRRTDVAGARAAGMATIRFIGVHDDAWVSEQERTGPEADAVISHWSELPPLLGL